MNFVLELVQNGFDNIFHVRRDSIVGGNYFTLSIKCKSLSFWNRALAQL